MRRSSLPTLTKTKGASSCPVFDPAKVAGSPFAFLMVAVFAMPSPVRHARRVRCRRSIKDGLPLKNDRRGDQQADEDRILAYRASDRLLGRGGSAMLSVTDNSRGRAVISDI
jgi:hypothetical protein